VSVASVSVTNDWKRGDNMEKGFVVFRAQTSMRVYIHSHQEECSGLFADYRKKYGSPGDVFFYAFSRVAEDGKKQEIDETQTPEYIFLRGTENDCQTTIRYKSHDGSVISIGSSKEILIIDVSPCAL